MITTRKVWLCLALVASLLSVEGKTRQCDSITVFGRVMCEGKPLADVPVSDGFHIVKTDSLGRYAIASNKWQSVVFIITPSGYEPACNKRILPQFWSLLRKKREVAEEHNFNLVKRNQRNHRMIFMSNLGLQNSHEDLMQFKNRTIPAARKIVKEAGDSVAVYTTLLGDISNCASWYSREFDVTDAVSLVATLRYPTMLYTVMGDQDNDGAVPGTGLTDYYSERPYVFSCGPKYFSMNIGDVHYIVLDNTVFRNEPGKGNYPTEIVGRRNYDRFVTSDQLCWLRKDLSLVEDKSRPVIVCMHHGAFTSNNKKHISKRFSKPEQVDSLTNCFAEFKNVHFVTSGSMDRRVSRTKDLPHIIEHSVASTSGDKWGTGYNGYESINSAGVTAGFEIFDINGSDISWHHQTEHNSTKPFRVYDMAGVGEYYRDNLEVQNLLREYPKTFVNYDTKEFEKYVYINWWGFEDGAKLEVFEDNTPLRVRQIHQSDPLYVTTASAQTLKNSRKKPSSMSRNSCQHLFRAQRTSPTSVIRVRATDPFGKVFEEVFLGKKSFTTQKR